MIPSSLGPLAQVVEQEAFNLCVIGSSPIRPISTSNKLVKIRPPGNKSKKNRSSFAIRR